MFEKFPEISGRTYFENKTGVRWDTCFIYGEYKEYEKARKSCFRTGPYGPVYEVEGI